MHLQLNRDKLNHAWHRAVVDSFGVAVGIPRTLARGWRLVGRGGVIACNCIVNSHSSINRYSETIPYIFTFGPPPPYMGVSPNGIQLSVTASILVCCDKSLLMRFQKDL